MFFSLLVQILLENLKMSISNLKARCFSILSWRNYGLTSCSQECYKPNELHVAFLCQTGRAEELLHIFMLCDQYYLCCKDSVERKNMQWKIQRLLLVTQLITGGEERWNSHESPPANWSKYLILLFLDQYCGN